MSERQRELEGLVREVAASAFGYDDLREGQEEAAAALLTGRDVLAVLPTGAGKSAIYQMCGALIEGVSVVVSPLIALQQDQVASIGGRLGGAAHVNSAIGGRERRETFEDLARGDLEFVFVSPEQLANSETFERLRSVRPSLFVVDEAHCISAWGHDFRPDYLRLGALLEALGRPQVLALTATAAPPVRREIVEQLGMRDPCTVVSGFERENLWLGVEPRADQAAAHAALLEQTLELDGTGIVFVATRRQAERLAEELRIEGREAEAYHAGMPARRREGVHRRFLEGGDLVVCATTAFGMGIDAPHVRFVLHEDPPESLDTYYQEFGRAGRDGAPGRAVIFQALQGASRRRFAAGTADVPVELLEAVAGAVRTAGGAVLLTDLAEQLEVPRGRLAVVADLLARAGALRREADDSVAWTDRVGVEQAVSAAAASHANYAEIERTRAEMVRAYVETSGCRWRTILGYLGESREDNCGHCDNCDAGRARGPDAAPFPVDARVRHAEWGEGQVVGYEQQTITVLFDEGGYRTLSLEVVQERGLLQRA